MAKTIEFDEFITSVSEENQQFVSDLHQELINHGCTINIKEAKSGYVVAYLYQKKTIANYVFRKKGMFIRIYGAHVKEYEDILDTFPSDMINAISKAQICKRLVDPNACNPKCSMGYDFMMKDEHYQKCRNGAFMFLVCSKNNPYIQSLLLHEVKACQKQ